MLKRIFAAVTASLLMLVSVNCFAASNGTMDLKAGQNTTASGAYARDGVVYLELEPVCREMGYTISYRNSDDSILLTNASNTIRIDTSNNQIEDNDHTFSVSSLSPEDTLSGGCIRLSGVLYMRSDLLSDLFGLDVQTDDSAQTVTVQRIIQNTLTIDTKRTERTEGLLSATIQSPVLSGPWSETVLATINTAFQKAADTALTQGRENAQELEPLAATTSEYGGNLQCVTYFDYSVKYNQNGLVSIVCSNYQYAAGAHGSTIQTAYTFDLKTGKQLTLSDLMKSDSGYQKVFDTGIRKEIDARVSAGELCENTAFQTLGDNPEFYLSNDGIVFYFQQYAYFPYAAGIQEFPFSYSSLSSYLNPSYQYLYEKLNRISG